MQQFCLSPPASHDNPKGMMSGGAAVVDPNVTSGK
jgi:hypothetical protein